MYSIVKEEAIKVFLNNYGIDYSLLSYDYQALIILLSNILFLIFWSIVFYILYRVFARIIDRWF